MPRQVFGEGWRFLPREELLTFEEIERLARRFVELGAVKLRLTGGEPLLRRDLPDLVALLAAIDPALDLALTTNGSLLAEHAEALRSAGLDRVSISLDSLDEETFRRMNDARFSLGTVLEGLAAAERAGLAIKVNAVIVRGINDGDVAALVERFRGTPHVLRFVEYMDVGTTNGWRREDVVPSRELVERIGAEHQIEPLAPTYRGEVAKRWRYADGAGEIGFISSVTEPFCGDCTRARLSADGHLYTCLFAARGTDLRSLLRGGASDDAVRDRLADLWRARDDRYSELRARETSTSGRRAEMSYLGG